MDRAVARWAQVLLRSEGVFAGCLLDRADPFGGRQACIPLVCRLNPFDATIRLNGHLPVGPLDAKKLDRIPKTIDTPSSIVGLWIDLDRRMQESLPRGFAGPQMELIMTQRSGKTVPISRSMGNLVLSYSQGFERHSMTIGYIEDHREKNENRCSGPHTPYASGTAIELFYRVLNPPQALAVGVLCQQPEKPTPYHHHPMQTVEESIYDHPVYYDLIFGSDWAAEYKFLTAAFKQHVKGKTKRLLEPACGTGRLLYRMIKGGYHCMGLDLNDKAIEFCNKRLERHAIKPTAFVADMCNFEVDKPCDAAFNTINSFRHLSSEQ